MIKVESYLIINNENNNNENSTASYNELYAYTAMTSDTLLIWKKVTKMIT